MKVLEFLLKAWPHGLFFSLIFLFIFVAPVIHDEYFVNQGKPIAMNIELPPETNSIQFALDGLEIFNSQDVYNLTGWAFLTVNKRYASGEYERLLVLQSLYANYVFQADTTKRIDIQTVFQDLGMDVIMSGLSALIFKDSVPQGTYSLGLIFKNKSDGSAYYVDLNQCVTRTPNWFWLEAMESSVCREVTHNTGNPVQENIQLPVETSNAKSNIESLNPLDGQGVYQLSGWAFPMVDKNITSGEYERQVILISTTGNFVFPAETLTRVDVDISFNDLRMDLTRSGISALISQDGLDYGSYELGVIFTHESSGNTYFVDTYKCITRNADGLMFEPPESSACSFLSR